MHSWPIETIRANHSIGRPIIANGQDFSGLLSLRLVWENSVSVISCWLIKAIRTNPVKI